MSLRQLCQPSRNISLKIKPFLSRYDTGYFTVRHRFHAQLNLRTNSLDLRFESVQRRKLFPSVSLLCQSRKSYATEKTGDKKQLVEAKEGAYAGLSTSEKVKEAGKDASYAVIIAVGIGITGIMFYVIGRELFSSQSPSGIFGDALKKCQKNDQLVSILGEPMKGYGEMTKRGRRRYPSHQELNIGGVLHLRMRFYVEGPHGKATVTVEMKKGEQGKYAYRYIVAELDGYPPRSVLVEDNT